MAPITLHAIPMAPIPMAPITLQEGHSDGTHSDGREGRNEIVGRDDTVSPLMPVKAVYHFV